MQTYKILHQCCDRANRGVCSLLLLIFWPQLDNKVITLYFNVLPLWANMRLISGDIGEGGSF